MIFTGFKRKTNQFFFNKKLKEFTLIKGGSNKTKIENILVICDNVECSSKIIPHLKNALNVSSKSITVFNFLKKNDKKSLVENAVYPNDFGWFGNIKQNELKKSLTKKYDLLINYNKVDNLYANIVLLQCKSNFNVGFSHLNNQLYQLLISCDKEDFKSFNLELKKYLTILNKL